MKIKPEILTLVACTAAGIVAYSINEDNKTIGNRSAAVLSYALLMAIGIVTAFLVRWKTGWPLGKTIKYVFAGTISGVIIWILYELLTKPETHNLFPLEIVISGVAIFLATFLGAFLTGIFNKIKI